MEDHHLSQPGLRMALRYHICRFQFLTLVKVGVLRRVKGAQDFCAGHFLLPEEACIHHSQSVREPPLQILLKVYKSSRGRVSDDTVSTTAKQLLMQVSDFNLWLQHLDTIQQNRQEGARKAAETRQKKKDAVKATECQCGVTDICMRRKQKNCG